MIFFFVYAKSAQRPFAAVWQATDICRKRRITHKLVNTLVREGPCYLISLQLFFTGNWRCLISF